ncbi:uncharacterized protein LOC110931715 [Helianthus annuus]|uniref:uncharacterized protein LOC110931715 n=1 Tax=Helianthus annuus TaxID=4232 RepID=UPI000B909F0F|nr:uncharacterized protein LOC110931715 [Helianthus annuus]
MAGEDDTSAAKNQKQDQSTDHGSPFYLHPSDTPRQMQIGFVDGTVKKPEKNDINHMAWLRCDAMIKGWLTTSMEKEIRVSVKYATTAEEIWKDLRELFGKESAPRAYELKQLLSMTKQDGSSVSAYYTRLRVIWDEIGSVFHVARCSCSECKCGVGKTAGEQRDKEKLYEFLLGLDNDYSTIRTQILAMKPVPSVGEAYRLASEDEQQRAVSGGRKIGPDNASAFHAYTKREG